MPDMQTRLDIDRILNAIDAKAVLVIIQPNDSDELETAAKGCDLQGMFILALDVTRQLGEELFDEMPESQKAAARRLVVLPTREDAMRLGMFRRKR